MTVVIYLILVVVLIGLIYFQRTKSAESFCQRDQYSAYLQSIGEYVDEEEFF